MGEGRQPLGCLPSYFRTFVLKTERFPLLLGALPVGKVILNNNSVHFVDGVAHFGKGIAHCLSAAAEVLPGLVREKHSVGGIPNARKGAQRYCCCSKSFHSDHVPGPASKSTICPSCSSFENSISILFLPRTFFTLTFVSRARRICRAARL